MKAVLIVRRVEEHDTDSLDWAVKSSYRKEELRVGRKISDECATSSLSIEGCNSVCDVERLRFESLDGDLDLSKD